MSDYTKVRELIGHVRDLASEKPDYVDNRTCTYHPRDDYPGCIFGQALDRMGWLNKIENHSNTVQPHETGNTSSIRKVLKNVFGVKLTNEDTMDTTKYKVVHWCRIVQSRQDSANNWASCIEDADKSADISFLEEKDND